MSIRLFFLFSLLIPSLAIAVNPSRQDPDNPPKDPKDVDKCKPQGSADGSFMYSLDWGGIPRHEGLESGRFLVREIQPSPVTYTSSVVYYQHPAAVKLTSFNNHGTSITASFIGSDSLPIQFTLITGQLFGKPTGQRVGSGQRFSILDNSGQPITMASGVTPSAVRIIYEDASSVDVDIITKTAIRYRSPDALETVFANLPSALKLDFIYKDGALRQLRSVAGLADLVSRGELGFEIRFYAPADEGTFNTSLGLYMPVGVPYRTVFFENPKAAARIYNSIKITDTWGSRVKVDIFDYNTVINDWTLSVGGMNGQMPLRRKHSYPALARANSPTRSL
jgi:hypothetical protein